MPRRPPSPSSEEESDAEEFDNNASEEEGMAASEEDDVEDDEVNEGNASDEDEDDDDDAPSEIKNVGKDTYEPQAADKSKRKRKRVRKEAIEAPADDVLERARLARLRREEEIQKEQAEKIKEFDDDVAGEDDSEEEVQHRRPTITVAVASVDRAKKAKANDGALQFAKSNLLGNAKRVPLHKLRSQRVRGPAIVFKASKKTKARQHA